MRLDSEQNKAGDFARAVVDDVRELHSRIVDLEWKMEQTRNQNVELKTKVEELYAVIAENLPLTETLNKLRQIIKDENH